MANWVDDAACFDLPTELFFFEKGEGAGAEQQRILEICNTRCPVRQQCLDEAMAMEDDARSKRFGIWGGMTPNDRKRLWRKMNGFVDQVPSADKFCTQGHVLDEANATIRADGYLDCKECRRERRRAKRLELAASA